MGKVRIIDITMWMGDWIYPGDKPFSLSPHYSAIGPDKEFCYNFSSNSADGTHIQGPHYMLKNGKKINNFPINYFRREAVIVNLRNIKGNVIPSVILHKELEDEDLKGKAVILNTGIMDKLIDRQNVKDKLLSLDDAKFLIKRDIKMIVTDTTCLDDPLSTNGECPITRLCCQNEIILVKQVCNLDKIKKRHVVIEAYPLKIRGISGTPCRVVVIENGQ